MSAELTGNKQRITYIDVAKGIGMLLIIFGHVSNDDSDIVRQTIFGFHVPLFFFISGFVYNYKPNIIANKTKRLLVPYFFASVVSIIIYFFMGAVGIIDVEFSLQSVAQNVTGMIYANSRTGYMQWNRPLWFLPCLFMVFIFAGLVELLASKSKNIVRVIFIIIPLIFVKLYSELKLPFSCEVAFYSLSFFEMGRLMKIYGCFQTQNMNKLKDFFFAVILLVITICACHFNGFAQVRTLTFGNSSFLFLVSAISGTLAICLISSVISHNKFLELIGRNSIPILMFHKFPIMGLQEITSQFHLTTSWGGGYLMMIFVTLITAFSCLIIGYVIRKIYPPLLGEEIE